MGRPLRILLTPEDRQGPFLVEITTRTMQSRLLITPSRELTSTTVGIVARGARIFRVAIHAFAFLSNHYHLIASADNACAVAGFVCYLNSNLAREAGRLHRWHDRFWGRRYRAIPISDEPEAQLARLRYVLAQGVKEGLVGSPLDWPGAHSARALVEGTPMIGTWHDRTAEYRARQRGHSPEAGEFITEERLDLVPLPALAHLTPAQQQASIREMIEDVEVAGATERASRRMRPLGRAAVLGQNPHRAPLCSKKTPPPRFHVRNARIAHRMHEAYRMLVDAYRLASARLRAGLDASFPEGTFPPAQPFVFVRAG